MRRIRLTIAEVSRRVAHLAEIASDGEAAHAGEDRIHLDVLEEIARGHPSPARLAAEAVKTVLLSFRRDCA